MYKKASRQKLRIVSAKGNLSVEQLWDLSVTELDVIAINLQKAYKESGKKSFLVKKSKKDKDIKLAFDIVLDILNTKLEEQEKALKSAEVKAHNQRILELIASKKDEELKNKSVAELEKMLK